MSNARIVGPEYPHKLTSDWEPPYRQLRLKELVLDRTDHDMATMKTGRIGRALIRLCTIEAPDAGERACDGTRRYRRARSA